MGARFIKKSDGNFYMRLDGNTTKVKFAAVAEAGFTYTFSVDGTVRVTKSQNGYTTSVDPVPSGLNLNNNGFTGTENHYHIF